MKKLTLFLVALLAFSCLRAEITYELNGGKYNDYGWRSKADMFAAFMTDAGATGFETLEYYMQQTDPLKSPNICAKLTNAAPALTMTKWAWLKTYIEQAHADQAADGASALPADGTGSAWRYAVGAFFVEIQHTGWPKSADFTELGKDAAYIPAWGQNYGNPTDPTEEVTLVEPYRAGYLFDGWYASADFSGEKVTTVDQNTTGTLYAKWVLDGIVYELNGGVWNQYGWESKKDMYDAFLTDWKAYSGSTRGTKTYEEQLGVGKSSAGIPTTISNKTPDGVEYRSLIIPFFTESNYQTKWGWLATYLDAVAEQQGKTTKPTTNGATLTFSLGNFFGEDNAQTTGYINAVDFTGAEAHIAAFQTTWGQSFPNPKNPTEEITLNIPYKKGYRFDGWYKEADFSGTPITKVDQNTKGTLYAKWVLDGIVYELNGGVWNQYGWESKKDMYDAFLTDWKAYSGSTRGTKTYEEQLGVGKSSAGIPTTISNKTPDGVEYRSLIIPFFTESNYQTKWGWLATYLDAVAEQQGKTTKPTTNGATLTFSLGNFFGEDNAQTTGYINAVDFTGAEAHIAAFQTTWGQSFPNPKNPTEEVVLNIAYKSRYTFEGWYDNAECTGAAITTVDENYAGTLYAKWSIAPITYNLNGGQYNEYGWESKKDVYDDFIADWNTYSGTTRKTAQYEGQLGIGKSNEGIPTTITTVNGVNHRDNLASMFTNPTYSAKWGWLATYIDAVAAQQGKTQPTTDANKLTFSLGNFFGEDNNHAADYIGAVDFTGDARYLVSAQLSCSFTLPNPTYPTSEVTINNPTKEGYIFDGWYANADFSGAKVTKVNADTKGTLYAKWTEQVIIIDENADNTTALAPFVGETVTAKVVRNFAPNSILTLTLPFDMNASQIRTIFGNAKVYEFATVVEDDYEIHLQFNPTSSISAGKPYILVTPTTGGYDAEDGFTIKNVTIKTNTTPVTVGAITMVPALDAVGTLNQSNQYYLSGGGLYNAGTYNMALVGLRAYFKSTSPLPVRARVVFQDNEATSIPMVEVQPENNVRKVMKNGQLIIIRGEQKYNVQGQRIE